MPCGKNHRSAALGSSRQHGAPLASVTAAAACGGKGNGCRRPRQPVREPACSLRRPSAAGGSPPRRRPFPEPAPPAAVPSAPVPSAPRPGAYAHQGPPVADGGPPDELPDCEEKLQRAGGDLPRGQAPRAQPGRRGVRSAAGRDVPEGPGRHPLRAGSAPQLPDGARAGFVRADRPGRGRSRVPVTGGPDRAARHVQLPRDRGAFATRRASTRSRTPSTCRSSSCRTARGSRC